MVEILTPPQLTKDTVSFEQPGSDLFVLTKCICYSYMVKSDSLLFIGSFLGSGLFVRFFFRLKITLPFIRYNIAETFNKINRIATVREKYLENEIFSRSGKSQGILWMVREI